MKPTYLPRDIPETVARLRVLADDLERLTVFTPAAEQIDGAPVLHDWQTQFRPSLALVGNVEGHLGPRTVLTSEIFAYDGNAGWARTFNRFYKLGLQAQEIAR